MSAALTERESERRLRIWVGGTEFKRVANFGTDVSSGDSLTFHMTTTVFCIAVSNLWRQ